jgi:hypothetical protein
MLHHVVFVPSLFHHFQVLTNIAVDIMTECALLCPRLRHDGQFLIPPLSRTYYSELLLLEMLTCHFTHVGSRQLRTRIPANFKSFGNFTSQIVMGFQDGDPIDFRNACGGRPPASTSDCGILTKKIECYYHGKITFISYCVETQSILWADGTVIGLSSSQAGASH